jgi:TrfA protein
VKEALKWLSPESIAHRRRLAATAERLALRVAEQQHQSVLGGRVTTPDPEVEFERWADHLRAAPNELFRIALFNTGNSKHPRRCLSDELLPSSDRTIRCVYTGEELRQTDLLVYLQVLHLMRGKPLGRLAEFTAYSMIQQMRHTNSKPNAAHRQRLLASLLRLQRGVLSVRSPRLAGELSLPLIAKFETQDAASGGELAKWRVALDPKMALLFGKSSYTLLDWEQRLKLSAGLASWLHGYFASHAVPGRVKLSTLQRASGSQTVASRKFAQLVRAALEELKAAKFLVYGEVRGDLVIVLRAPCA